MPRVADIGIPGTPPVRKDEYVHSIKTVFNDQTHDLIQSITFRSLTYSASSVSIIIVVTDASDWLVSRVSTCHDGETLVRPRQFNFVYVIVNLLYMSIQLGEIK